MLHCIVNLKSEQVGAHDLLGHDRVLRNWCEHETKLREVETLNRNGE
jgi:hypothetical protein